MNCCKLCRYGANCPGKCCGIPFCVDVNCMIDLKFAKCWGEWDPFYWRMLLQVLLGVFTHIIAFYLGRYFCFDGMAVACDYSSDPAAAEESGAVEDFGTG